MRARLLFLAFVMVFFTTNVALQIFGRVYAAEFHVTNATGLQNALTTAQNNGQDDTIYLAAGVYSGGFSYEAGINEDYSLTIKAESEVTANQVILDGKGVQTVLCLKDHHYHPNGHFVIKGISIQNGYGWETGGIDVYRNYGSITITNNMISGCVGAEGGGIYAESDGGSVIITNNIITKNRADWGGGIECGSGSGPVLIANNTIIDNTAGSGGGVGVENDANPINFYNNIIWGNEPDDIYLESGQVSCNGYNNSYHNLSGTWTNSGANIDADPLFVNPAAHDYHLSANSPCIDKGTADAPELPDTDFEGDPRVVGAAPDIGADEVIAIPVPDIKVNNSDGPITLYQNDTLTITVSLNNNGITDNADWWLAADTPFGLYFFTFDGWTDAWVPGYQGPLFYLDSFEVLNMPVSGLPAGTYTLYFGVDTVMDGDVTWDSVYYDTVEVNII